MTLSSSEENRESTDPGQRGVALVAALLLVLLLSTLTAAAIFISTTETWTTANYRTLLQARYAAEAGAARAANWLAFTYTAPSTYTSFVMTGSPVLYNGNPVILSAMNGVNGNYPDAAVQTPFNAAFRNVALPGIPTATYSVTAALLTMDASQPSKPSQRWQITSRGSIGGVRPASVQVVLTVARTVTLSPAYAIFATSSVCAAISMSGNSSTDSFDSSLGTYAATHQNSRGDVGTNGNVKMGGSTQVWGTLSSPNPGTGSCSGGSQTALTGSSGAVSGGLIHLSGPQNFPTPPEPTPTPPTTAFNIPSSPYTLAPGTYGNVMAGGHKTINVSTGTYNVNSIVLSGSSSIVVTSGPVIFNVGGSGVSTPIDFGGGSTANLSGIPSNLQFNYGGTGHIVLSSGGTQSYEVLNAPNSDVTVSGGGDVYGSILGRTVTLGGGTSVHFDRALQSGATGPTSPFRPVAFSWSKY
jgi:Tfp pilus assembly protein PilX